MANKLTALDFMRRFWIDLPEVHINRFGGTSVDDIVIDKFIAEHVVRHENNKLILHDEFVTIGLTRISRDLIVAWSECYAKNGELQQDAKILSKYTDFWNKVFDHFEKTESVGLASPPFEEYLTIATDIVNSYMIERDIKSIEDINIDYFIADEVYIAEPNVLTLGTGGPIYGVCKIHHTIMAWAYNFPDDVQVEILRNHEMQVFWRRVFAEIGGSQ